MENKKVEKIQIPNEQIMREYFEYENEVKNLFVNIINLEQELMNRTFKKENLEKFKSDFKKPIETIRDLSKQLIDFYKDILESEKKENESN